MWCLVAPRARRQQRQADLAAITRHALDSRGEEARRHGITITSVLQPAQTTGDSRLLERLVANLVDNALQHNVANGRVEIRTGTDHGLARIEVTNTGPVIPAEATERIFEPFPRHRHRPCPQRRRPWPRPVHRASHRRHARCRDQRRGTSRGRTAHPSHLPARAVAPRHAPDAVVTRLVCGS
jgi:hypothetical protein